MTNITQENAKRRVKRKKQTAEVFTPDSLVNDMLNKLPDEVWEEEKTFCDPACGNGNFLINILRRKISLKHSPLEALKTIYGVDIKRDNIRECRLRLLKVINDFGKIEYEHVKTVMKNIIFLNQKGYPQGTLDYDLSFSNSPKREDIEEWLEDISNGELNLINLPVREDNSIPDSQSPWGDDAFNDENDEEDRT